MKRSTITISRQLPVTAERAFDAWLDPTELAQWWWPQWPDTSYELDPHEGGNYRIFTAAVGIGVCGTFTHLERPRSLTMTWTWIGDGEPGGSAVEASDTVEVHFVPNDDGTEVIVTHTTTDAVETYQQGWNDVLDRLAAMDAKVPPQP